MATKKGAGNEPQNYNETNGQYEKDGAYNSQGNKAKELSRKVKKNSLSSQEWAIWYGKLDEVKHRGYYIDRTQNDDMLIRVETKNKTPKLIITTNSEKIKIIFSFNNSEELFDALEWFKNE